MISFVEKRQEGRKTYFDVDPQGVRQVLDKTIPYVTVTKRNEQTGQWESYGYLALAKSGNTVRVMVIQKEAD